MEELSDFYRVKHIRLKPNNKKKKVIHSCDVFKFTCNLDSYLHIISFITNNPVPGLDSGQINNIENQAL